MIKMIITLEQKENGLAFEVEQNGTDVTAFEDFMMESVNKVVKTYVEEVMNTINCAADNHYSLN